MVISIDFDGTCVTADFPYIGKNIGAQYVLKALTDNGHQLILHTLRGHTSKDWNGNDFGFDTINKACEWFAQYNIPLWGVNINPQQEQEKWTDSPKPYSAIIIDDYALGCPLREVRGHKPFVDWIEVLLRLLEKNLLANEQVIETISLIEADVANL